MRKTGSMAMEISGAMGSPAMARANRANNCATVSSKCVRLGSIFDGKIHSGAQTSADLETDGICARMAIGKLQSGGLDQQAVRITARIAPIQRKARSEEHTSELQSRFDLVCRLL